MSGRRVLDAGCGPGIYAEVLLERGADVVAFDVTPEFVEITRGRVGDRAAVLRADLSQPLDFAQDDSFDGVLCPLVLDYIEDWGAVFREFYRVLQPGGFVVFSAGHPMADWNLLRERQPENARSYFETQQFTMEWGGFGDPPPTITSFRRPLAAMLNPLTGAGLLLDQVLEPLPTPEYQQAHPEGYAELLREPGFICIRARKP